MSSQYFYLNSKDDKFDDTVNEIKRTTKVGGLIILLSQL